MLHLIILIFVIVLAITAWYVLHSEPVTGGRVVPITHIFDLPAAIEYVDEVTGEKLIHNTRRDRYRAPETDEQIRTVARHGTAADYGRLIQLLSKFHRGQPHEIVQMLQRKDSDVYAELRRRFPRDNVDPARRDAYQADGIYRRIRDVVTEPAVYLDIGCNRGGITRELARLVGAKRTLGVDVIDWKSTSPLEGVEYTQITGALPYEDDSVDFITANMTLHHIKDVAQMMAEIHRVLRPGGHLVIKEHDCWNVTDAMLIDIEHLLYNRVGGDDGEYHMHHYTNYSGWDKLAQPLKFIKSDYFYPALRNEMTATRAFWAVYQKAIDQKKKKEKEKK